MSLTLRRTLAISLALAAAVAAVNAVAPPLAAQERPRPGEGRGPRDRDDSADEDENDRDLPFSTDRLFVPRWRLTDGPQVRAAFRTVVEKSRPATVLIRCDGRRRGLGGIIAADGWVLTKATPLCDQVVCILADGRELPARTVATNGKYDLALLKIDAAGLPTLDLADAPVPAVGDWLATVGVDADPLAVGVVSVPPREIPAQPGRLGIMLPQELDRDEPVVVEAIEDGAADEAGVKAGDRIVSIEGQATTTGAEVKRIVGSYNPGDVVALVVKRGAEELTIRVTLQGIIPGFEGRSEFQNNLGGRLSVRRFGFPLALQHDTVLRPTDCGGPLVDLDGRVIGFNIARAGRTESYAIPTSAVREVIAELMAGAAGGQVQVSTPPAEATAAVEPTAADTAAAGAGDPANNADKPLPDAVAANESDAEAAANNVAGAPAESVEPDADEAEEPATAAPLAVSQAAAAYESDGYKLVWSDEFNADGRPDPTKWGYERGFVRNEELQWYRPDNARCEGGMLVIEGRKERVPNPRFRAGGRGWQEEREFAEYTSASLLTRGKHQWQYGRFEMRGRIDARPGLWPAWWTLGNGGWPACGEIDIMEYYRGMLLANAAWAAGGRWRATWDDSRTRLAELGGSDWANEFHVWRMDWDENRIALYVDGRLLNEVDLNETFNAPENRGRRGGRRNAEDDDAAENGDNAESGDNEENADEESQEDRGVNPFRAPHYMILNLALGGTNGGDVGDTEFPAKYEIDYVRVYQK